MVGLTFSSHVIQFMLHKTYSAVRFKSEGTGWPGPLCLKFTGSSLVQKIYMFNRMSSKDKRRSITETDLKQIIKEKICDTENRN